MEVLALLGRFASTSVLWRAHVIDCWLSDATWDLWNMHVAISSHLGFSNMSSECCVHHTSRITHMVRLHSVTTGSFLSSTKHSHAIKPLSHSMSVLSALWIVL